MDEFAIWPLTRRMVALFESVGAFVCRRCGCVNANRYAHEVHIALRCRFK